MVIGTETEYGILEGWSLPKAKAIQLSVLGNQPALSSVKEGEFLGNGGRVYVDQSKHNEFATPETHDPAELVIHELAGRQLMSDAAARNELALICSNLDPGTGHTWGTHENYEYRRDFEYKQLHQLYTHLVSRIIYAGAGGLDPSHPGVRVILSPRVCRIRAGISGQGTVRKSLVFIKPENYSQHKRLHIFCGESLLSHTASYLKYASTALVAHCLQAGLKVGPGPFADSPIQVLRRVNRDIGLGVRHCMQDGRRLTALEIQREIFDDVARQTNRLPAWAPVALQRWSDMLDALSSSHPSLTEQLDWLIYYKLFNALAEEHGFAPEDIRRLNQMIGGKGKPNLRDPVWGRLATFRAAANELYVRLHVLGQASLFAQIEQLGWLNHRLPEISDAAITRALHEPPPGRAANRSRLIKQYAGQPQYQVTWDKLVRDQIQVFDIPENPGWDGQVIWRPAGNVPSSSSPPFTHQLRAQALELFQAGRHDEAEAIYLCLLEKQFEYSSTLCHLARIYLRTGRIAEAREAVDRAWLFRDEAPVYVLARIHYLNGLLAMLEGEDWVPDLLKLKDRITDYAVHMQWIMQPVLDHLKLHLGEEKYAFMSAVVAVINHRSQLLVLLANPLWQALGGGSEARPNPSPSPDADSHAPDHFTYGSVVITAGNCLILREYDFVRDRDVEREYVCSVHTKWANATRIEDLAPNDQVILDYIESGGRRVINVLVKEEAGDACPNPVLQI